MSRGVNPDSFASIVIPSLRSVNALPEAKLSEGEASKLEPTDFPEHMKVDIIKLEQ